MGQELAAKGTTGVRTSKILGRKSARIQQGNCQCITEGHRRRGARCRGQIQRTRLFAHGPVEVNVCLTRQRGSLVARDGNQAPALTLDQRHNGKQFVVFARVGNGDEHVAATNHAQVAMHGFCRVNKVGRRSGTGQSGRHLACNVPRLADAADNHSPLARQNQFHGLGKVSADPVDQSCDRIGFNTQNTARHRDGAARVELLGHGHGYRYDGLNYNRRPAPSRPP